MCTCRRLVWLSLRCPFCALIPRHRTDARALIVWDFIEETSSGAEAENCQSGFCIRRAEVSVPRGTSSVLRKFELINAEERLDAISYFQSQFAILAIQ